MAAPSVEGPGSDGRSVAVGDSSIELPDIDSVLTIISSFDVKGSNTGTDVTDATAASSAGGARRSLALASSASLFPLRLALCAERLLKVNRVVAFPPRVCRARSGELGDIKCSRTDADDTSLRSNGAAGDLSTTEQTVYIQS